LAYVRWIRAYAFGEVTVNTDWPWRMLKYVVLIIVAWGVGVHGVRAQANGDAGAPSPDAADGGGVPAAGLESPVLRTFSAADYPQDALAGQREADVLLRLAIAADGHVTAAEVVAPAGQGFDEAAVQAALRFEFTPARRAGTPIAARIMYRYEFRLPVAPAPAVPVEPEAPPPPPPPAAVPRPSQSAPAAVEVSVQGTSAADRLRQSAEAVTVLDTQVAQRRSADLGTVLVALPGVNVRRDGGLGSSTRFSLNGLSGDQVRLFLDGLPLELVGYPFGIANVPVNLIDRVEIYSGVVPIRFGADALGGAVNLVSERPAHGAHGEASYQVGSFETHRLTLNARQLHEPSGFYGQLSGLLDYAKNDYPVIAQVSDDQGRTSDARVYRFHDAYSAEGANLELGFTERSWAERLSVRAFVSNYSKEYQSNLIMSVPYGGLNYRALSPGVTLQYKQPLARNVTFDGIVGYTYTRAHARDLATCTVDWYGRCTRERDPSAQRDELYVDHNSYARIHVSWQLHPQHTLRLTLAPNMLTRAGEDRRYEGKGRDPLTADRSLWSMTNGLEYQLDVFDGRLENILFIKQYVQGLGAEEVAIGNIFRKVDRDTMRFGAGDGVRLRLVNALWFKASYEFATRLPNPEEVFGDNVLVSANLGLKPEISHNGNVGFALDARRTQAGAIRAHVNGFLREADQLIMLLASAAKETYQNVYAARSIGFEAAAGWTMPHDFVALDANVTYQDFRNRSNDGTFASFKGDRIPSQPYLFANGSARFQLHDVFAASDELTVFWTTRYVHSYDRGWQSLGDPAFKQTIAAQLVHSAGVGYLVKGELRTLTTSLEVQNLSDERVYDYFGAQRPGRAVYAKMTASF
jgi:vitamin B12 transporter